MRYFLLEPEVPGGVGSRIQFGRSTTPFTVLRLHAEFDDWLGSEIVQIYSCYLMTERAQQAVEGAKLSGVRFAEATVTTSDKYADWKGETPLPPFAWAQIVGVPGVDDFGLAADGWSLIVSEEALRLLKQVGLFEPEITPYSPDLPG
jgi:hypothetical protein